MPRIALPFRAVASCLLVFGAPAPAFADEIGYAELIARLGGVGVPLGTNVNCVQVEAPVGGAYGPDQTAGEFASVTFTAMSGAPGNSWHANTVAQNFYSDNSSIAPGINNVWLYEATNWAGSAYLKTGMGAGALPLLPPSNARVFNHSWIGTFGSTATDNDANRRCDFAMNRDDTLFCVGLNNGTGVPPPLLSYMYNGLSVGRTDGAHSFGNVPAGYDGAGRMKPEIVAPGGATSWTTPIVSAAAALLYETANTPPYNANPNTKEGVVLKSALMAGALHRPGWTNNPETSGANRGVAVKPLDVIYGADALNVNQAHWILTSGEQGGSSTVPEQPTIGPRGWDFKPMTQMETNYYRFRVTEEVADVSILVAWNRVFGATITSGTVANFDLRLFRAAAGSSTLISLVGDGGLGIFDAGNVASLSTVDNVEHLFLRDLAAGDYVIELKRVDGSATQVPTSIAWFMPDTPEIIGDANGDLIVDGADITTILGFWGTSGPIGDVNHDGIVDGGDITVVLGNWD